MFIKLRSFLIISQVLMLTTCVYLNDQSNITNRYYDILDNTLNNIEFINSDNVYHDIFLPHNIDGLSIKWNNISHSEYLDNTGRVVRPSLSTGTIEAKLEAICSFRGNELSKEFIFRITPLGHKKEVFTYKGVEIVMIYIPTGLYKREDNKEIVISDDFYIGEVEIDNSLFNRVMYDSYDGDSLPAVDITWDQAVKFCKRLSSYLGLDFRLPTEHEWEYAADSGLNTRYSGSNIIKDVAIHEVDSPVDVNNRELESNSNGIYHMSGNVREWTSDRFLDHGIENENPSNPASSGDYVVIKGGGFKSTESACVITSREYAITSSRRNDLGFRISLSN